MEKRLRRQELDDFQAVHLAFSRCNSSSKTLVALSVVRDEVSRAGQSSCGSPPRHPAQPKQQTSKPFIAYLHQRPKLSELDSSRGYFVAPRIGANLSNVCKRQEVGSSKIQHSMEVRVRQHPDNQNICSRNIPGRCTTYLFMHHLTHYCCHKYDCGSTETVKYTYPYVFLSLGNEVAKNTLSRISCTDLTSSLPLTSPSIMRYRLLYWMENLMRNLKDWKAMYLQRVHPNQSMIRTFGSCRDHPKGGELIYNNSTADFLCSINPLLV